jgi:hypothetical protein
MEEEPAPIIIESGTEALRNGMEDNQQVKLHKYKWY